MEPGASGDDKKVRLTFVPVQRRIPTLDNDGTCARRRREWAHDRECYVGKLGKDWNDAVAKGWSVVSMKDDWKTILRPASQ